MITTEFLLKLQTNTEELIREFQGLLQEVEQVTNKLKILDQREESIKKQDQDLSLKVLTLTKREASLQTDIEGLQKRFSEHLLTEDRLNKRQQALDQQIKQHMADSINKEKELNTLDQTLRIKEKELAGLWEREKTVKSQLEEINVEKQMIEREKKVDRERKLQLDSRESLITGREEKMQRLINS